MRSKDMMKTTTRTPVIASSLEVRRAVQRAIQSRPGLVRVLTTAALSLGAWSAAHAGPQGGTVTSGQGSIATPNANTTVIQQNSNVLGVDWQSFNVSSQERVQFNQPSANAVALNRILDQNPSQIFGQVASNGRVVLLNPNGIVFGKTAQLNVGSLVASSLKLANFDPVSGRMSFDSATTPGAVVNSGTINAAAGGSVALLGGRVTNDGMIVANYGSVALGAGKAATLDFTGDGLLQLKVTGSADANPDGAASAVANSGTITANGGTVLLTAQAAKDVFTNVLNNDGIVRANRIDNVGGEIRLLGTGGAVVNSGTLDASGVGSGSTGGAVTVLGDAVSVRGSALVDASGDAGGGKIRIGGDFHGANPDPINATTVDVSAGSRLVADSRNTGDAGSVAVWSDGSTTFDGMIYARALGASGSGGNAEVSGKQHLTISGHAALGGVNGANGTLLLDPGAVEIINGVNNAGGQPDKVKDAWIVDQLDVAGGGSNVTVTTANGTTGAQDLKVDGTADSGGAASITWSSANKLTLIGNNSVNMAAGAVINNVAAPGGTGLQITAGAGGATLDGAITLASGNLNVTSGGSITGTGALTLSNGDATFGAATGISLTNTGNVFVGHVNLSGTSATLVAATDVDLASVALGTGALDLTSHTLTQSGDITAGALTLNSGTTHDITLDRVGNAFTSASVTAAGTVTLVNSGVLDLGAMNVTGDLNVTTQTGGITNTGGAVTVGGNATFTANGAAGQSILVDHAGNDFTGTVSFASAATLANLAITSAHALDLQALTLSGTLNVTAAGISQSGALAISGATTLAAGSTNDISLGLGNDFSSVAITSGRNVTLNDTDGLSFGASTISGTLGVTAVGTIAQTAGMTVGSTATFAAGSVNDISLGLGNNFNTVAITSGRNVTLNDTNGIVLGTSTISGTLGVTAAGTITDSGSGIGVTGATTLAAGAGNDITLNGNNDFSSVAITSGRNVSLNDTNGLSLGASTISGTLGVTAAGPIVQTAGMTVASTATFAAGGANDITLSQNNNFNTVAITSGHDVLLNDTNGIALGTSTVSGALGVTAAGAITQTGSGIGVTGTTTLAAGAGNDITLNGNNDFSTVAISSGNDVAFNDQNAVVLGASSVSGTLDVTSNGTITQTGVLNVTGTATFGAGTGHNVTLNLANQFGTVAASSGQDVLVTNATALDLGPISIDGNLSATATTGDITNTGGALTIGGNSTFTVNGAGPRSILVNDAGNNFTGTVAFAGTGLDSVSVTDNSALDLQAPTLPGSLHVIAAGIVQTAGVLNVTGTTTLAAGSTNDITLNAANDFGPVAITSGHNVALTDVNALTLGASTVSGTLGVTTAGLITQSGALNVTGTTTLAAGGANNITLNAANNFGTVSVTSGHDVSLTDSNALGLGAMNVAGNLSATASSGGITNSGALHIGGTSLFTANGAGQSISVNNAGNNFTGTVTFAGTALADVSVTDTSALDLLPLTLSGDLNVTAAGITQSGGGLVVNGMATFAAGAGNNIVLALPAANNFGTVAVTSGNNVSITDLNAIDLGPINTAGTLDVTANLGSITNTAGTLTIGGAATFSALGANQSILVNHAGNTFASTVSFIGGALANVAVTDADASLLTLQPLNLSGNLSVTANGGIAQGGAWTIGGTTTLASGSADINLTTAGNAFTGVVSVASGGNANLSSNVLNFGAVTLSGNLAATAVTGDITSNGALAIAGNSIFTVNGGAPRSIIVNNAGNNFGGTVSFAGAGLTNVAVTDTSALDLQGATLAGTLNVNAAGITQSGALNVGGTTTLAAGAGNDITLNAANNFNTVAIASGHNVALTDVNALTLGASTVSGTLGVTAAGPIIQSGALNVTGTTTLAAGGTNDITLNAANNFGTVTVTSGHDVSLTDSNALDLGPMNVAGNLSATASNGDIMNSGALIVGGNSTFTANGGGQSITVNNAGNTFGGTVGFAGTTLANVSVVNTSALNLQGMTLSGALNVNAAGITQTGALIIGGATTLAAGAGNDIALNAANDFNTVAITVGRNVALTDVNALSLGASTVSGTLGVTTAGAITQSGPLTVAGLTTLAAGAGNDITLNAANNFSSVAITSARNVALTDSTALDLQSTAIAGTLSVTAAGITQSGAWSVAGTTTLAAGANDIALGTAANDFSTVVINSANNVTLADANALNLGASNVAGALTLTAGGNITDSGNIVVVGATTLAPGAAGSVVLDQAGNNFGGPVGVTNGTNVTLVNAAALNLGAINITGNLGATAAGDISGASTIGVGGNSTFTASGTATSITVNNTGNNFGGSVSFGGTGLTNVAVADSTALDLQASTLTGNLSVTAAGITQSGALSIGGVTTLNSGSSDITLGSATNNFSALSVTAARNITLVDTNGITLRDIGATGNTSITAGGAIADDGNNTTRITGGSLVLSGTSIGASGTNNEIDTTVTDITATASAGGIYIGETDGATLTTNATGAPVNITAGGALTVNTLSGSATTLNAGGALTLGTVNVGTGAVSLTATGAITDGASGNSITGGTLTMNGGSIGTSTNRLNTVVASIDATATGGGIFLGNTGATALKAAATGGPVDVASTGGAITVSTASGTGITLASSGALTATGALTGGTGAINLTSASGGAMNLASVTGGSATLNSGGALSFTSIDVGTGAASLTASGSILDGNTGTSSLKAGALTLTGASIGDANNVLNTAVTSVTATASSGSVFLADLDSLQVTGATANAGTLQFFAGNATSAGSLTVGNLSARDGALLVASNNIFQTSGTTITAPVAELRAGFTAATGGGVTGQIGQLGTPVKFDTNLTKLDMYIPFASIADPTVPAVKPNVDGPETVTPVVHTFATGNAAATQLTQTGIDSVNDAALLAGGGGLGTTVFTRSLDSQVSRLGTGGDTQILYVDWSAYDPSISLFGTLTPALRLPADQREDEETGWVLPSGYMVVSTSDGHWKVVPVFRNRIAQADTVRAPLR